MVPPILKLIGRSKAKLVVCIRHLGAISAIFKKFTSHCWLIGLHYSKCVRGFFFPKSTTHGASGKLYGLFGICIPGAFAKYRWDGTRHTGRFRFYGCHTVTVIHWGELRTISRGWGCFPAITGNDIIDIQAEMPITPQAAARVEYAQVRNT
jgi:hypothetical protein